MHKEAMKHIRSTGITVFIDVQQEDILKRLHRMKVHFSLKYRNTISAAVCAVPGNLKMTLK